MALPRDAMGVCRLFVIVVFPDHTHLLPINSDDAFSPDGVSIDLI